MIISQGKRPWESRRGLQLRHRSEVEMGLDSLVDVQRLRILSDCPRIGKNEEACGSA